ncbi:MAG: hypothetical protein DRQ10_06275 [Candidatus Hydrothermota bacterium]|nr:MAG: hypothetical protein DRQ10_06275 [Candidatus Hydrothermae bacterium]
MICEQCRKRKAEILFIEVIGDRKRVLRLCNECAEQMATGYVPGKAVIAESGPVDLSKMCPYCGLTYKDYRFKGQFGCAQCYTTFIETALHDLGKIHGTTKYRGRPYIRDQNLFMKFEEIVALEQQLKAALRTEDFERAARLRDKIKVIESKILERL